MTSRLQDRANIEMVELPRNENAVSGTRVRNTALETSLRDVVNTARIYSDIYGNDKCLDKINEIIRIVNLIQKGTIIPEQHSESDDSSSLSGPSTKTTRGGKKTRRTRKKRRKNKKRKSKRR